MFVLKKEELTNMEALEQLLDRFIINSFDELEEEGSYCLDICEEEDNYTMVSFWVEGTYQEVENFLMEHYKREYFDSLCDLIISRYPNNIDTLKTKMGEDRAKYKETLTYECLATLLMKEYENSKVWYTVYGSDYEDYIDLLNKHNILSALENNEEFPIIKSSDLAAAMMGVSYSVVPSEMYDIFAYYADSLKDKENTFLEKERLTFTPDTFQYEAVNSRWKNYVDMAKNHKGYIIDFVEKFVEAQKYAKFMEDFGIADYDLEMAFQIKDILINDYTNRFSSPPISLPLHNNNLAMEVISLEDKPTIQAKYKIRGVEGKKSVWKNIMIKYYDVPQEPQELMEVLYKLAIDIKVSLVGMEAQKATKSRERISAIEGQYPRKNLATHGLRFIDDMNVHYKDSKGRDCKKDAKARFTLAMAEKQSMYLLKKILRYSNDTTLSCSFGVDSIIALHMLRRITKKDTKIIFNNSKIEYNETYQLKKWLEKEWNLNVLQTNPVKTYWELLEENGWNFDRKGDRRSKSGSKKSNSELCCYFIKHKPFYDLIAQNNFNINISGLRADESRAREQAGLRDGAVYYAKSWNMIKINPIIFFTDSLVWNYISKYSVPYSKIYDMKLYAEDVFDKVDEEDYGKVIYSPRTGCWACAINTERYYFSWLKKFKPLQYFHLMKDRGLAKTLFEMNAHKVGLAKPKLSTKITVKGDTKVISAQISLFDTEEPTCNSCSKSNSIFEDYSSENILEKISVETMESWITRRPCTFMSVS